jgi:Fe-S protein assembly co-chaperone HscB
MDPFAFFEIAPSFQINNQLLRKAFLANQRKWHPDFHAGNPEMYSLAMENTAANNEAYAILNDAYSRLKFLLAIHHIDVEKIQVLPPEFLMEMMDLSDMIEDCQTGNQQSKQEAEELLEKYFRENELSLTALSVEADNAAVDQGYGRETLLKAAALYQQHRYLCRLRKNISGIKEL